MWLSGLKGLIADAPVSVQPFKPYSLYYQLHTHPHNWISLTKTFTNVPSQNHLHDIM